MAEVKLNLSGHYNGLLEEEGFIFPGALHVDLADEDLEAKLTDFLKPYVGSGDSVVVALPGLAPLAALTLAVIHGLSGHFPVIVPLVRSDQGFVPGPQRNLQDIRNDVARQGRDNIVAL